LYLDRCRVPAKNRLGSMGAGPEVASAAEKRFRLAVAAIALGIATAAFDEGRKFAVGRQQFGAPIALKQAIGNYFADSAAELATTRHSVLFAAWHADHADARDDDHQASGIA